MEVKEQTQEHTDQGTKCNKFNRQKTSTLKITPKEANSTHTTINTILNKTDGRSLPMEANSTREHLVYCFT